MLHVDSSPGPTDAPTLRRGLFRQYYAFLGAIWVGLDVVAILGVLLALAQLELGGVPVAYRVLATFAAVVTLLVYQGSTLFSNKRSQSYLDEARALATHLVVVFGVLLGIGYVTDTLRYFSGQMLLEWAGATYVLQLAIHAGVLAGMRAARSRSMNIRRALLAGSGEVLTGFARTLEDNRWLGIEIIGYVELEEGDAATAAPPTGEARLLVPGDAPPGDHAGDALVIDRLGSIDDIAAVVDEHDIDQVYITAPMERAGLVPVVTRKLLKLNVDVNWVPDLSVFFLVSHNVREIDGQPILCLSDSPLGTGQATIKWLADRVLGALALAACAPVMALIAAAVKLTSPGPALYVQPRLGLNGEEIRIWKFRTMTVHGSGEVARQAVRNDERVTPVGRFLRRWSLDELPQLWQVVEGSMSLVGPRPHPLWLNDQYVDLLDGYMQRHRVKPGLTGWAQVNGWRGETDSPRKMEMRLRHDLYYINNWSLVLDLRILVMTLGVILNGRNAY